MSQELKDIIDNGKFLNNDYIIVPYKNDAIKIATADLRNFMQLVSVDNAKENSEDVKEEKQVDIESFAIKTMYEAKVINVMSLPEVFLKLYLNQKKLEEIKKYLVSSKVVEINKEYDSNDTSQMIIGTVHKVTPGSELFDSYHGERKIGFLEDGADALILGFRYSYKNEDNKDEVATIRLINEDDSINKIRTINKDFIEKHPEAIMDGAVVKIGHTIGYVKADNIIINTQKNMNKGV